MRNCKHPRRIIKIEGIYCALCGEELEIGILCNERAQLMDDVAQARQAALKEARDATCKHCADGLLFDELYQQHSETNQYGANLLIKCAAIRIRALISGVGLHASQQPHATDAESTRG